MKNRITVVTLTVICTVSLSISVVAAGEVLGVDMIQTGSLRVGIQGMGGVTFFNGTIVNETTTDGVDNPVTFGDNVRIDGTIQRGDEPGPGDGFPVKINDDVEISGKLTITEGSITFPKGATGPQGSKGATGATGPKGATGATGPACPDAAEIVKTRNFVVTQSNFLNCLGTFAEITSYLDSDDYIFCWNLWISGTDIPSTLYLTSDDVKLEVTANEEQSFKLLEPQY